MARFLPSQASSRRHSSFLSPAGMKLPALTASAMKVTRQDAGLLKRLSQPWQRQAMSYYERAPEARFAANYQGNALAQIRIYPAFMEGTEREETEDEKVVELLNRIHDPNSIESTEIQRAFGKLMLLTGEGYLLCTGTGDSDEPEEWEFVSNEELRVDSDGRLRRFKAPGGPGTVYENPVEINDSDFEDLGRDEAVAYRFWRPSPRHSMMPDSPMQAVLDLFEELILLQMAVRARVRSRLSGSGLVLLSDSVTLPAPDATAGNEDPKQDRLMHEMILHMMKPIEDEGSASAVVPFMLRTPLEEGQSIRDVIHHIRFSDPNETYREQGLRKECIERIATGMDIPAEILLGLGDLNHWNAWQVDEQVAKAHIFPTAALYCSNLTASYLRPAARDAGIKNWENLIVWYDPAELVVHPDKSGNARELYDRGELKGELLRDAHGYTEDDGPDDEELLTWFAKQNKDPAMIGLIEEPEPQPLMLGPDGQPIPPEATLEKPVTGVNVAKQAPQEKRPSTNGVTAAAASDVALVLGASEFGFRRAREIAGSRARARARSCEECLEGLEDVPNDNLVAALGPERLEQLKCPSMNELVAGAGGTLARTLQGMGVTEHWATVISAEMEKHAARTLDRPDVQLPAQFADLVARMER